MATDDARMPPMQILASWLSDLAASERACVLLGGAGHLELSPSEQTRTRQQLEASTLPRLASATTEAEVWILTGLAPGADLLFSDTCAAWFKRLGRVYHRVGLLPVPVEVLWQDWLSRSGEQDHDGISEVRRRFDAAIQACDEIVPLWDEDLAPDWQDLGVRQRQYRRLAAVLAEQCDVLVAILRPGHPGQAGGTSELVAWRQQPASVPRELSSGPRVHLSGWRHGDRLILVDPGTALGQPASDPWIQRAREALRGGNYLLCYDLVSRAEQQGHASNELHYLKLLALANSGSAKSAQRRLEELPAELRASNEDWLALQGRLYKDLALRGGSHSQENFRKAAAAYQLAFQRTGGYFSAINAASMALLGGEPEAARSLAAQVLAQITRMTSAGNTDHYYLRATEAEAALLLGDTERVRSALERADRLLPDNLNARSRTRQQLALLCRAQGLSESLLSSLKVPPIIYLQSQAGAGLRTLAADAAVRAGSFVFAGITEPGELATAEQFMHKAARLHLVLAAEPGHLLTQWQS